MLHNKYLLSLLFLTCACALHAANVTYTPDNTTDFPNPERGFYDHVEWHIKNGTSNLTASYLTAALAQNRTLILRLYYLDQYRSADIPANVLTAIGNDMALLRQYGCKAILRFAYDADTGDGYQDASLTWWKKHLDQLKPILAANADVIYVVQAGFMGIWGEWYYSSAGTGSAIPSATKTQLIDKLLECVPASRCVQLRTPKFKRDYTGYTAAMSASDAYKNTSRARLGHHNDAFLNGEKNSGTYENRTTDMAYLAQECLYVPNGGENNVGNLSTYNSWATGTKAKAEMAQLHYSYLNAGYDEFTTNKWKSEGAFAEISRNLGYRYQLTSATLPDSGAVGKIVHVQLSLTNVGYAPLYNERHAYIVFKNSSKTYSVQLTSDPRTWLPNGAATAINENITLPNDMVAGTYQMYLWLPDDSASIASKPAFAVRFANTNIWESSTGYNKLNASIKVTSTGGDRPGPTPDPEDDAYPLPGTLQVADAALSGFTLTGDKIQAVPYNEAESAYATWPVQVLCTGNYAVSALVSTSNGYKLEFYLLNAGGTPVAQLVEKEGRYNTGNNMTISYGNIALTAGTYTFQLKNNLKWTEAYIHSVTLSNPNCSSTAIDTPQGEAAQVHKYIRDGRLYMECNGHVFTVLGLRYR